MCGDNIFNATYVDTATRSIRVTAARIITLNDV